MKELHAVVSQGCKPCGADKSLEMNDIESIFCLRAYTYGFNGMERDDEVSGSGNSYTAEFWQYDSRLGRRWNTDPVVKEWESPYATFRGNPIYWIDPSGDDPSTHTDEDGNVIAVKNDGDNGVYKHKNGTTAADIDKTHGALVLSTPTSAGGEKVGETEHWDEFVNPGTKKAEGKIQFGDSWESTITSLHTEAMEMDLQEIGNNSKSSTSSTIYKFDIKGNPKHAPYGPMTGRLLDGKYATARSAGNYLAGWNGRTGTYFGFSLSKFEYMNLAGSYQKKQFNGISTAADIIFKGKTFGPPPYYGEEPYSGRMIIQGWDSKRK